MKKKNKSESKDKNTQLSEFIKQKKSDIWYLLKWSIKTINI